MLIKLVAILTNNVNHNVCTLFTGAITLKWQWSATQLTDQPPSRYISITKLEI